MDEYIEEDNNDLFTNNITSTLAVKADHEKKLYDYSWLEEIEEVLPYLNNIMKNPKKFIVNEEEIVKIELARKVTVESVIHLTQHTNLIQDIDKKTGDVKPSKILNINKEESLDTYENRFVYTLINNVRTFFEQRLENTGNSSYYADSKKLNYLAKSLVGNERIDISLEINAIDKALIDDDKNKEENQLSIAERLKFVKTQLDGLTSSELYQSLAKLHVPPVRSPIRKTNVILKNPNFRKAEELWNYVQSFEKTKDINEKTHDEYLDNSNLKKQYDKAFLMTYIANKNIITKKENLSTKKVIQEMISNLIDSILDSDEDINTVKIKEMFDKELQNIKLRNERKTRVITNIFSDKLLIQERMINEKIMFLEKEIN